MIDEARISSDKMGIYILYKFDCLMRYTDGPWFRLQMWKKSEET